MTMEKKKTIPVDAAQAQLDLLTDFYYVNVSKEAFKDTVPDLLERICQGLVEINLNGDDEPIVTQHLAKQINDKKTLVYKVVGGTAKTQMRSDTKSDYMKIYSLVGALCESTGSRISQLKGVDMSVVETLGTFFLAI